MAELQTWRFECDAAKIPSPPRKSGKIRSVGSPQATRCNTSCLVGRFYVGYFALVRSRGMGRILIPIEVGLAFLSGCRAPVHPMGAKAPEKGRHPFFTIDVLA